MEGGGKEVAFANEDGEAVAGGEGFDVWASLGDAGGADEDHLERVAGEFGGGGEDGGVDLAAVGVALDGDVEGGERFLRGILYVLGEKDRTCAGAEGGGGFDEGLERVEEAATLEEFEEGGGLAAGDDEAVEVGELGWGANELCSDAKSGERFSVGFECALKGEDADGERCLGHASFDCREDVFFLAYGRASPKRRRLASGSQRTNSFIFHSR